MLTSNLSSLMLTPDRSLPWPLLRRVLSRIFPSNRCTDLSKLFPFISSVWCRFHTYTWRTKTNKFYQTMSLQN
jgi:hypothetical protein